MALHFNCGQYEQAFDSKKLQNWEQRHQYRKRPGTKAGFTQIIANDRGHLLPSLPRASRSPWGTFVGTWDLPRKLPGNKQTDPTARSADAHIRRTGEKAEADDIIYGRNKTRRAKAGQPLRAMPTHCQQTEMTEAPQHVPSVRSGAENPIVKGTPSRQTPTHQLTPQDAAGNSLDMTQPTVAPAPEMISAAAASYSSPNAALLSPGRMEAAISNTPLPRSPNHGSPLPPLPRSAASRVASPKVATPKPTSPARFGSAQRLELSSPIL